MRVWYRKIGSHRYDLQEDFAEQILKIGEWKIMSFFFNLRSRIKLVKISR